MVAQKKASGFDPLTASAPPSFAQLCLDLAGESRVPDEAAALLETETTVARLPKGPLLAPYIARDEGGIREQFHQG